VHTQKSAYFRCPKKTPKKRDKSMKTLRGRRTLFATRKVRCAENFSTQVCSIGKPLKINGLLLDLELVSRKSMVPIVCSGTNMHANFSIPSLVQFSDLIFEKASERKKERSRAVHGWQRLYHSGHALEEAGFIQSLWAEVQMCAAGFHPQRFTASGVTPHG
jgi:hypothetical protein